MPLIKDSSVEEVKAAADIVELVSARTQLRKVGGRFQGRCPFHEERTPSFSVSPEQGFFYCFGCGKGGDLISFVRETESLDFAQAVEWLADRYRVQLEYEETSPGLEQARGRRARLLELLDQATRFYERVLWESEGGAAARGYLSERGLGEATCREYRLGLSPGGRVLADKAREKGFTQDELIAVGLVNRRGNDYFAGRLLFPLADARGRVVGFGARRMSEDDPLRAKYVNSPEGELFHKASIVYGLHRARSAIAKDGRAVVVEGYTDVLALHQAGLEPVVASMGTALTKQQLRELVRLARRLYLCFDSDAAGEAATLRGMELAAEQGLEVRIVALPPGLDPADAAEGFEARLPGAEGYLRYRVRMEVERAPDRQQAFARAQAVLARFEENPERQEAIRFLADRLDLSRDVQAGLAPRALASTGTVSPKLLEAGDRLERDALAGCLAYPELRSVLAELPPEHLDGAINRRVRAHLLEPESNPDADLVERLAELDARAAVEGIDLETGKQLLLRLRERSLQRELSTAAGERSKELQGALAKVREAVREFA